MPRRRLCVAARIGAFPTYALTDNEKTVTVEHVARIAIRNPDMVVAAGRYGLTVATCLPADAPSKGGAEATVRVAKADLVPTEANLLEDYSDWVALETACETFCEDINARSHRVTRRAPVEMLAEERRRLHRVPEHPWTSAFRETRTVGCPQPMVQLDWCLYSVPWRLAGETVCVRCRGEEVIVTQRRCRRAGRGGPPPANDARQPAGRRHPLPAGPRGPAAAIASNVRVRSSAAR